ncbi:MAG: type II toxin-antitoxin system HicA family toxin [Chloroflexi bacterium]|nr:type II toxin-antitoxin system HicA family toxin [Chloroflexota bacterium]
METNRELVRRRLERDGWYLRRHGAGHDIYRHPSIRGIIALPRHRTLSPGVRALPQTRRAGKNRRIIDGLSCAYR